MVEMSKIKNNRLEKLEKQLQSTTLRIAWLDRGEDGDAKIAELIASGHAKAGDEFMLVSWARGRGRRRTEGQAKWRSKEAIAFWKIIKSPVVIAWKPFGQMP